MTTGNAHVPFLSSLQGRLALATAGLLAVVGAVMGTLVPNHLQDSTRRLVHARAVGVSALLERSLRAGLEFEDDRNVQDVLEGVKALPDVAYAAVYNAAGKRVGNVGEEAPASWAGGTTQASVTESRQHIVATTPIDGRAGAVGTLLVAFSLDDVQREAADAQRLVLSLLMVLAILGIAFTLVIARSLVRPVAALTELTNRIVTTGDLRQVVEVWSSGEAGVLAGGFQQLVDKLRGVLLTVGDVTTGIANVIQQEAAAQGASAAGGRDLSAHVRTTRELADRMQRTVEEAERQLAELQDGAGRGAGFVKQGEDSARGVSRSTQEMGAVVKRLLGAISTMVRTTQETDTTVKQLAGNARETTMSMERMGANISRVSTAAQRSAALATEVETAAHQGTEVVEQTMGGIQRIQGAADEVATSMRSLAVRLGEVDAIVNVIDDVSNQTHLLALNANIAAARAGAQGSGFAVIAQEVGELARRTRASAGEIAALVATLQGESARVRDAVNTSVREVRAGMDLGRQAAERLQVISARARDGAAVSREIADATREQQGVVTSVSGDAQRAAEAARRVEQLARAQVVGAAEMESFTSQLVAATTQVTKATEEQIRISQEAARAILAITGQAGEVARAQREQREAAHSVRNAVVPLETLSGTLHSTVDQLGTGVKVLQQKILQLQEHLARFRY